MIVWMLIIIVSVAADQLSKLMIVRLLNRTEGLDLIDGVLRFTYVENRGAAFGMLDEHRWVFMIISTVAIIGLCIYMWKFCPRNRLLMLGLSLIVGGGIGNMVDRIFLGYVVDFIDFYALGDLWKWVFNVADVCVCVGAGIVALYLILEIVKEAKAEKLSKAKKEIENEENEENE